MPGKGSSPVPVPAPQSKHGSNMMVLVCSSRQTGLDDVKCRSASDSDFEM